MGSPLPGSPHTWKAKGLSDAIDASNAFPGAMQSLANLIPSPSTREQWVPRPAAVQKTAFAASGTTTPAQVNALLTVGNICYGFVADTAGPFAGKDVPFAFNTVTNTFETITFPQGAASLPTTPATTGDWSPPSMAVVAGRVIMTHPGYPGAGGAFFGWLDISGFSDATASGNTHSNLLIDGLSKNVLQAGWMVGMAISGGSIPANTIITSIASNGLSLTISNPAGASALTALTTVGGGAATPLYASGNTNGNALAAVPVWVIQFNGRAYFAVGAGLTFSDAGSPCQVTNATQAFSFRNGLNVTVIGPIGLFSSTVGGVIQSIMAFQGDAQIWQVQGDITFSTGLTINALNEGVGSLAQNTVTSTPIGLAFVGSDGVRMIDATGKISDPIGISGDGVVVPFLYAINPSRMVAAFNQGVLRITVQNGFDPNQATQEYWLDFSRKIWSGPHSFPAAQIVALQTSTNSFIMAGTGINAKLWQSDVTPGIAASYIENGTALTWTWTPCLLPDNQDMSENAMIESAMGLLLPPGASVSVAAIDELGNVLDQVTIAGPAGNNPLWDIAQWDSALWDGASGVYRQYPMNWHRPLVFKQCQIMLTGTSLLGEAIGNLYMRIENLEFQMQSAGGRV